MSNLSRSEILEAAQRIRAAAPEGIPHVFSEEENNILQQADAIVRERSASGISTIVQGAIAAIAGERRAAELALETARRREEEIEQAVAAKAQIDKAIVRELEALNRLETLAERHSQTGDEALVAAMRARFWARHEPRLPEHLAEACKSLQIARDVQKGLPIMIRMVKAEILRLENEAKAIAKKLR